MDTFDWLKICILVLAEFEGKERRENLGWDEMVDELHTGKRAAESEEDEIAIWVFYSVISNGDRAELIQKREINMFCFFFFLLIILQKTAKKTKEEERIGPHKFPSPFQFASSAQVYEVHK